MKKTDFKNIQYFSDDEKWGDIEKMNRFHVIQLSQIRAMIGWPVVIHGAYAGSGHSENSYHYKGMATDFHFKTDYPLSEQWTIMNQAVRSLGLEFNSGIGVYPGWNSPGFHFDSRPGRARWIRSAGAYVYDENIIERLLNGD